MRNLLVLFMLLVLASVATAETLTMEEGTNIDLQVTDGANPTLTISSTATDENVKVSADDTTPGFLNGKLVGGSGITLTEGNGGGDETLTIAAPETLTTKGDVLVHNGTSETRLPVGSSGQYLTSDANDNLLWANPPEGDQLFNSNVLLNAYRTAENGSRPVLKIIDGVVDALETETGVDINASTNEDYDSGNDLYEPIRTGTTTIPMVNFDGTNDYLTVTDGTLGQTDSEQFTISFWCRSGEDGAEHYILNGSGSNAYTVAFRTSNKLSVYLRNTSVTNVLIIDSTTTFTEADGLMHIVVSVDMANNTYAGYKNGSAISWTETTNSGTGNVNWTDTTLGIGRRVNTSTDEYKGDIGQFYFTQEYLDLTVASNLAKFIDALGNPVDLGSNGSTPTGNRPLIYLNNTTSTWQNNLGSGGNFTENGALTDGTDISTSGTAGNMTLVSNSQTAKTEPNGANILLLAEDLAADITLNTDLKASVSRDGGTTFTQVTLSDAGEFEKGNLLTGTVDLSGQPTGTDMEWKVETLNNKFLNLHGVGLEWR